MKKTISIQKLNRRRSLVALCMVAALGFALICSCAVLLSGKLGTNAYAEYSLIPTIDEYRGDAAHDFKNFNLYVLDKTDTGKTVVDEKGNPVNSFTADYNYIIPMTDFDAYTNVGLSLTFTPGIFSEFVDGDGAYKDANNNAKLYILLGTEREFKTFTVRSNGGMADVSSITAQSATAMNFYSSANYKIGANIAMTSPVTMVSALYAGTSGRAAGFSGEIDGQGFQITGLSLFKEVMTGAGEGLTVDPSEGMRVALIGKLLAGGVIRNLGFRDLSVDFSGGLSGYSVKAAGLVGENAGNISHTYIYSDLTSSVISGGSGASGIAGANAGSIDNVYLYMSTAPQYRLTASGQSGNVTNAFYVADTALSDNAGEQSTANGLKAKLNSADASESSLRDETRLNGAKWYTLGSRTNYIGLSGYRNVAENGVTYQTIYNPADFINISTGTISKASPIGLGECVDMSYVSDTAYTAAVEFKSTLTSINKSAAACAGKHVGKAGDANIGNHNVINLHLKPSGGNLHALFILGSSAVKVSDINFVGGSMNYAYAVNDSTDSGIVDKVTYTLLGVASGEYSSTNISVDNVHSSFSFRPLTDDGSFYVIGKSIMVGGLLGELGGGDGEVTVTGSSVSGDILGGIQYQKLGGTHSNDLSAFGGVIAKSRTSDLTMDNVTFAGVIEGSNGIKRSLTHNYIDVGGLVGVIVQGDAVIKNSKVTGSLYSTAPQSITLDVNSDYLENGTNHTEIYNVGGFVGAYWSQNAAATSLNIEDSAFDGKLILNEIRGTTTINGANQATLLSNISAAGFVAKMNLGKSVILTNCTVNEANSDTPNIELAVQDETVKGLNASGLNVYGIVGQCVGGSVGAYLNGGVFNPVIDLRGIRSKTAEIGGGARDLETGAGGYELKGSIVVSTDINNTAMTAFEVYGLGYTAQSNPSGTAKVSTRITASTGVKVNGDVNISGGVYSSSDLGHYVNNANLILTGGLSGNNVNIAGLSIGGRDVSFNGSDLTNMPVMNIDNVTAAVNKTLSISGALINAKKVDNLINDAVIGIGGKTDGTVNAAVLNADNITIAGVTANLYNTSGDNNNRNVNNSSITLNLGDSLETIKNLYIAGVYANAASVDSKFYLFDNNASNTGDIELSGSRKVNNLYLGGTAGYTDSKMHDYNMPLVRSNLNRGNIKLTGVDIDAAHIGGIIASVFAGYVSSSNNMGAISVTTSGAGTYNIGGIYGTFADNIEAYDLTLGANLNIGGITFNNAEKSAAANIGGIGGYNDPTVYRLINRYNINYGNIDVDGGKALNVGGMVGNVASKSGNYTQSTSVINHGDITANNVTALNAGGIHGYGNARVEYSVNYGGVSGSQGNLGMIIGDAGNSTTLESVMAFYHAGTQKVQGGTAEVTIGVGYTNAEEPAGGYGVSGIEKCNDYEMYGYDADGKFVGNGFTAVLEEIDSTGTYKSHVASSPYANVDTVAGNPTPNTQISGRESKISVLNDDGTKSDRYFIYAVSTEEGKQGGNYLTSNSMTSENERLVWAQITESRNVDIINANSYYDSWQLHAADSSGKKITITPTVLYSDTYKDNDGVSDIVGGRITFSVNLDSFFADDLTRNWKIYTGINYTGDGLDSQILSSGAVFSAPTAVTDGLLTDSTTGSAIELQNSPANTLNNVWRIYTVVTVEKTLKSGEKVSKPWRIEMVFQPIGNSVRLDKDETDADSSNDNERYMLKVNNADHDTMFADNADLNESQVETTDSAANLTYRYNRYFYGKDIALNMGAGYTDFTYSGYKDGYNMGNYYSEHTSENLNQNNLLIQTNGSIRAKFVIKGFGKNSKFTAKLVSKNDPSKTYPVDGYDLSGSGEGISESSQAYYDTSEYLDSDAEKSGQLTAYDVTTEPLYDEAGNPVTDESGKPLYQNTGKMYLYFYLRDTLPQDDYYLQITYSLTDSGVETDKIGAEIDFTTALSTRAALAPNATDNMSYSVFNYGEATSVLRKQSGVRNRICEFLDYLNRNGSNNFAMEKGQTPDFGKLLGEGGRDINLYSFISGIKSAVGARIGYPHNGNGDPFTIKTERKTSQINAGGTQFYYYVYSVTFRVYAEAGNYKDYTFSFTEQQYNPLSDTSRLYINGAAAATSAENVMLRVFTDGVSEIEIPRSITGETYVQIGYNHSSLLMSNNKYWQTADGKNAPVFVVNKDGTEYEFDWFNDPAMSEINVLGVKITPTLTTGGTPTVQFKISFTSESEGGTYAFYIKYKPAAEDDIALSLNYADGVYTLTAGYDDFSVIGGHTNLKRGVADGSAYDTAIQTQAVKAASREHVSFGLEFGQPPDDFFIANTEDTRVTLGRWEKSSNRIIYKRNDVEGEAADNYYRTNKVNNFYLNPSFGSDDETVLSTWLNFELYQEGTGEAAGIYNTMYVNLGDMGFPTDNNEELKNILVMMGILTSEDSITEELYETTSGGVSEKWLKIKYYTDYTDFSTLVDRSKNIVINESISIRFMLQAENKSYYSVYTVQPKAAPEDQSITVILNFDDKSAAELSKLVVTAKTYINTSQSGVELKSTRLSNIFANIADNKATVTFRRMLRAYYEFELSLPPGYSYEVDLSAVDPEYRYNDKDRGNILNLTAGGLNESHTVTINVRATDKPWGESDNVWA